MARGGAALGVGVIAAVGAGGVAEAAGAQGRPGDPAPSANVAQRTPGPRTLPAREVVVPADTPVVEVVFSTADAGEALRVRILQQAERQRTEADESLRRSAFHTAAEQQRKAAAERAEEHRARTAAAQQATAKEKARKARAAAPARNAAVTRKPAAAPPPPRKAPQHRTTQHQPQAQAQHRAAPAPRTAPHTPPRAAPRTAPRAAPRTAPAGTRALAGGPYATYTLPVGAYTLTAGFGQAGSHWSARHTGEDFAAPTGTPVKAVSGGRVTSAGWAGAYGYRIVQTLEDGTEVWYCHLSSMVVTSGPVAPGTVIGRVGATGNVTGPHLHLEVRPGGGGPVDPLGWLRGRGLDP
ncbi:M23 family metallopeptidase [Streptomyces mashuensis]|uniref:M23 family metallopeptidase n=1 Tax=Streptomyces mashuensis TaxID=33904 RepID=UPI00227D8AA4|nr:M23 family metallopeptidase [Streptomyces mashuensis]